MIITRFDYPRWLSNISRPFVWPGVTRVSRTSPIHSWSNNLTNDRNLILIFRIWNFDFLQSPHFFLLGYFLMVARNDLSVFLSNRLDDDRYMFPLGYSNQRALRIMMQRALHVHDTLGSSYVVIWSRKYSHWSVGESLHLSAAWNWGQATQEVSDWIQKFHQLKG